MSDDPRSDEKKLGVFEWVTLVGSAHVYVLALWWIWIMAPPGIPIFIQVLATSLVTLVYGWLAGSVIGWWK